MQEEAGEEGRPMVRGRGPVLCLLALLSSLWTGGQASAETVSPAVFQPAFHQALRWSTASARMTYRMKVPLGRAGSRVRVSFKAGDGALRLYAASIALAGPGGALASEPVPLTFNGSRTVTVAAGQRITGDPVAFAAAFGAEVAVSFEVDGALAASAVELFPGSFVRSGSHAMDKGPLGGTESGRAVALETIDVEGAPTRAFLALGDSITEGYVSGQGDDARNSWAAVAQGLLKLPVVNAAVSGQGVDEATTGFDKEVLPLQGITDCVVLIGTNNLGSVEAPELSRRLEVYFARLRPFCRLWVATLLPKDRTTVGTLEQVNARRRAVNLWIRTQAVVAGVIDFEAVTCRPDNVDRFQDGLASDGIHPSVAGQRKLGEEAARFLAQAPILALTGGSPAGGPPAGGNAVVLTGTAFKPGLKVLFDGQPATRLEIASATSATATVPGHAVGLVEVVAKTLDGQQATLPGGYTYVQEVPPLSLAGVQPKAGATAGGTAIALSGSGFAAGATVLLGGVPATSVRVESGTSIKVVAPAHAMGLVDVELREPDGRRTVLPQGYRYGKGPRLDEVAPEAGVPGELVTLAGGELDKDAVVTFGAVAAPRVVADGGILRVTAPAHDAGPVDVTVTNPDGLSTTLLGGFVYSRSSPEVPEGAVGQPCGCGASPRSPGMLAAALLLLAGWARLRRQRAQG